MKKVLLAICVVAFFSCSNAPEAEVWETGLPPVGVPVVGVYLEYGRIVSRCIIRTDFAGIFDYTGEHDPVMQRPKPEKWVRLY
jgi:hypothetical protein